MQNEGAGVEKTTSYSEDLAEGVKAMVDAIVRSYLERQGYDSSQPWGEGDKLRDELRRGLIAWHLDKVVDVFMELDGYLGFIHETVLESWAEGNEVVYDSLWEDRIVSEIQSRLGVHFPVPF